MLSYDETVFGIQKCKLELRELFPTDVDRRNFYVRYEDFLESDPFNKKIFSLQGDLLTYSSEVFVSEKPDNRPPLLLLLGNPASHSVDAGVCFASEKGGQKHRFWKLLEEIGVLTFLNLPDISSDLQKNVEARKNALMELNYLSPFRIGIAVFYSLPSAASNKNWLGVSGIRRLLGTKAFNMISFQEEKRIALLISRFIRPIGGIITFQKDAYNRLRSQGDPAYDIKLARQGLLVGNYLGNQHIFLASAPPTREAYWSSSKSTMLKYKILLTQLCSHI